MPELRERIKRRGDITEHKSKNARMQRAKEPVAYALIAFVSAAVFLGLIVYWNSALLGGFSWTDPRIIFNLHPLLMSLGFVILPGLSLSLFQLIQPTLERRQPVKLTHASIHVLGFGCSIVGLVSVFRSKNENNLKHLWSFHGWAGFFLSVLFPLLWVISFLSFLFPGAPAALRVKIMAWHRLLGLTTFVMACVVTLLGITERTIFTRQSAPPHSTVIANMASVFLVLFAAFTVYFLRISHSMGSEPVALASE